MEQKGSALGLLPIGAFLLIFIGGGIFFHDFYAVPAIAVFLIALLIAFLQKPKMPLAHKLSAVTKSMGEENVMVMCLIFILAGAFSGAASAAGGVSSTVNFGLSILPPHVAVAGLFVIGCFISLSMGTSVGTIVALTPIAVELSQKTGMIPGICVGAVVCGAMFGDNLSMISDTTIAATRSQGCHMKDKFRENIRIVWPAAVLTLILFLAFAGGGNAAIEKLDYNFWQILPYLAVLGGALAGMNVFAVLGTGTVLSIAVGLGTGTIAFSEIFTVIATGPDGKSGIAGMYEITAISLLVAGIIGIVKENGGIAWLMQAVRKRVKSRKGAQMGIALLSSAVDISTANNTVAIVMAAPIVKDIAQEYEIPPKRTAALMDIFTSVCQGLLPYGAQVLYACAGAAAVGLTPFQLTPYLFYPILMGICALLYILFEKEKK
ncbi:MAG: Na+/H+ antiporter NhaC family protein [Oscillospiraceae bacterium]|nr:Na+/H+ antiporter NhaC family protein [Oscillospiraceae bacterium]